MTSPRPPFLAESDSYATYWERFYRDLQQQTDTRALWDVDPSRAAAQDWQRFSSQMDLSLPMVDLGCGTGAQTAWLASKCSPVIGVDVSSSAVEVAEQTHAESGACYRLQPEGAPELAALAAELGDSNIYIRGVLHQLRSADLPLYQQSLRALIGLEGAIYFVEISEGIHDYLQSAAGGFARLPGPLRRTLISRFPPGGLSLDRLQDYFPAELFQVLVSGESGLHTNLYRADDQPLVIPAVFGIVCSTGRGPNF